MNINSIQLIQLLVTCIIGICSILLSKLVWKKISKQKSIFLSLKNYINPMISYFFFLILAQVFAFVAYQVTRESRLFDSIFQLSLCFLVSHYVLIFTQRFLLSIFSFLCLSSLWFLTKFSFVKSSLASVSNSSLSIGSYTITPYSFIKSIIVVIVFLWITSIVSNQIRLRIKKLKNVKATTIEILTKAFDIFIYVFSGLLILNILGINLSALTFIGGALGVGIGFGLQKITSNFISGLILLFEKSIEINDLVEMDGGIYGFIRRLGSRFTLIETFDGKEVLIPNEDFITNRVTNWTFSNKHGRVEIPVGVSYKSDIKKAQQLILESAKEHHLCIAEPEPVCFLREFGDSSVNFLLLFFINDVTVGRWGVQSEVMMTIWDKFKEHNIEIPFPQRDIHIKTEA